jgi:hypothetical protein
MSRPLTRRRCLANVPRPVPLIDRNESVLVVVDMQPLFMANESMSPEVQAEARASFDRAV